MSVNNVIMAQEFCGVNIPKEQISNQSQLVDVERLPCKLFQLASVEVQLTTSVERREIINIGQSVGAEEGDIRPVNPEGSLQRYDP